MAGRVDNEIEAVLACCGSGLLHAPTMRRGRRIAISGWPHRSTLLAVILSLIAAGSWLSLAGSWSRTAPGIQRQDAFAPTSGRAAAVPRSRHILRRSTVEPARPATGSRPRSSAGAGKDQITAPASYARVEPERPSALRTCFIPADPGNDIRLGPDWARAPPIRA